MKSLLRDPNAFIPVAIQGWHATGRIAFAYLPFCVGARSARRADLLWFGSNPCAGQVIGAWFASNCFDTEPIMPVGVYRRLRSLANFPFARRYKTVIWTRGSVLTAGMRDASPVSC